MNPGPTEATKTTASPTTAATAERTIVIRLKRQADPKQAAFWEEFAVPLRPNMNIISVLQWIAAHPVTTQGKQT
ncbi:MAG: succinate dehydrogenase and fumarate reductase iron-sulfur protein, partial [Phycisphaerales bacterium]|nr:succinate dehydrogenase and fumarate reductase iron-sulfur protein [Phycisphaerales bacterium]